MNNNIFDYNIAFMNGNLFKDLYNPYKNYTPEAFQVKNDYQDKMLKVMAYSACAHDINLYLDNYPNDNNMINKYNEYRVLTNQAINNYEKSYGPITLASDSLNYTPWLWEELNFPWEGGNF